MNFNNSLITWLSLAAMFNSQWVDAQELNWKPTKDKAAKQEAKLKKDKHVEPAAYYSNTFNDYTTQIFDPYIKTLIIHHKSSELEMPIIKLGSGEQVVLRFDDLSPVPREFAYSFEHCTYDWKSSELNTMDYQTGFKSALLKDYDFSFNTIVKYTHFDLAFPNEEVGLNRSGNYIIKIHAPNKPDQLYLVARFMVLEPAVTISGKVLPSRVVADRDYRQEVNLDVNLATLKVMSPYQDIDVVVMQNWRSDNAVTKIKPSFIYDQQLTYNYTTELSFEGMNEFRFFDAKSLRYRSERVADVSFVDTMYQLILSNDHNRAFQIYTFQDDLNGRFLIKNDDGLAQTHLESDYLNVNFSLKVDAPLGNGDLYVFGQLSQWGLKRAYRMNYDPIQQSYKLTTPLKQGFYNYMYLWRYNLEEEASADRLEGSHSIAENEYHVFVYFKDPSAFSHRLVGYKVLRSLVK